MCDERGAVSVQVCEQLKRWGKWVMLEAPGDRALYHMYMSCNWTGLARVAWKVFAATGATSTHCTDLADPQNSVSARE